MTNICKTVECFYIALNYVCDGIICKSIITATAPRINFVENWMNYTPGYFWCGGWTVKNYVIIKKAPRTTNLVWDIHLKSFLNYYSGRLEFIQELQPCEEYVFTKPCSVGYSSTFTGAVKIYLQFMKNSIVFTTGYIL